MENRTLKQYAVRAVFCFSLNLMHNATATGQ